MKAALVIAHPGHELRAFAWATQVRPVTYVLTRGDGHGRSSRLESTRQVLEAAGAVPGSIFGRFSDRELYEVLLRGRLDLLLGVRDQLADAFIAAGTNLVACDAEEYYNPSHDICHYLTVSAAFLAARRSGVAIPVFDFPLIGPPDTCPEHLRPRAVRLELDDETFQRKLENARRYPELKDEVDRALAVNGAGAFRIECLRPVDELYAPASAVPFYELYGERQVQAGRYADVIRFDPHVRAVRDALLMAALEV